MPENIGSLDVSLRGGKRFETPRKPPTWWWDFGLNIHFRINECYLTMSFSLPQHKISMLRYNAFLRSLWWARYFSSSFSDFLNFSSMDWISWTWLMESILLQTNVLKSVSMLTAGTLISRWVPIPSTGCPKKRGIKKTRLWIKNFVFFSLIWAIFRTFKNIFLIRA